MRNKVQNSLRENSLLRKGKEKGAPFFEGEGVKLTREQGEGTSKANEHKFLKVHGMLPSSFSECVEPCFPCFISFSVCTFCAFYPQMHTHH